MFCQICIRSTPDLGDHLCIPKALTIHGYTCCGLDDSLPSVPETTHVLPG